MHMVGKTAVFIKILIISLMLAAVTGCGAGASASGSAESINSSPAESLTQKEGYAGSDAETAEGAENSPGGSGQETDDAAQDGQAPSSETDAGQAPEAGADTEAAAADGQAGQTADSEDGTIDFKDVKGMLHTMRVSGSVRKHDYNWEYLRSENGRLYYEDENYKSLTGVDVSYFQGNIDWEAAAADGIEFAYIRLGYRGYGAEGTLNIDPKAVENLQGAQAAGLKTGVYFFSQALNEEEAAEEAAFVLQNIEGLGTELPIVYDPEEIKEHEARTDGITGDQLTKNAAEFCRIIEEAGYQSMLYTNLKWEAFKYDLAALNDIEIWYADYKEIPQTPYHFEFWQYTEKGTVAGIEGAVDLDLWMVRK